jgi:Malectin domain
MHIARMKMVGSSGVSLQRRLVLVVLALLLLCDYCTHVAAGLVRGAAAKDGTNSDRQLQVGGDVGSVTRLDLINAITDLSITPLSNDQVILVSSIPGMNSPNFNIEAKTTGNVASVVFALNGVTVWTENAAPWAFCGNSGPDFSYCPSLNGTVTVSATPYAAKNGGGLKGTTVSVTFTIALNAPTSPTTKSPTKSPMAPAKSPVAPAPSPVAPTLSSSPLLINCGSTSSYPDSQNRLWLADVYFDTGSGTYSASNAIANTVDDTLYQTERTATTITYTIPRPPGTYAVTLHFAEI